MQLKSPGSVEEWRSMPVAATPDELNAVGHHLVKGTIKLVDSDITSDISGRDDMTLEIQLCWQGSSQAVRCHLSLVNNRVNCYALKQFMPALAAALARYQAEGLESLVGINVVTGSLHNLDRIANYVKVMPLQQDGYGSGIEAFVRMKKFVYCAAGGKTLIEDGRVCAGSGQ